MGSRWRRISYFCFYPRCAYAFEGFDREDPRLLEVRAGQLGACRLWKGYDEGARLKRGE